jgi:broad specificity phosphatase PhoE
MKDLLEFRDTKLTEHGKAQCLAVHNFLDETTTTNEASSTSSTTSSTVLPKALIRGATAAEILESVDLVAVSPLTRTLQTMSLTLFGATAPFHPTGNPLPLSLFQRRKNGNNKANIKILAQPLLRERVFMLSDVGTHVDELEDMHPHVDFDTFMGKHRSTPNKEVSEEAVVDHHAHKWWYHSIDPMTGLETTEWQESEWRPKAQKYLCQGEPTKEWNERMCALYDWLESREEETILLVCHWGVCNWMCSGDDENNKSGWFENCEMRKLDFWDIGKATEGARAKWGKKEEGGES